MISDLLCKFPPIYHNKVIPNFKKCHLAACEDLLYVSFEAESKIYVLNESYELLGFFGEGEDAINSDFPETSSLDEALKTSSKHRKMCGHYGRISYAGEYLFREFFLPDNNKGIQIYKNHMLVHTLYQIDKDFTIIGYINPYYYAFSGYDMENERLT